jgi:hypothetical protein
MMRVRRVRIARSIITAGTGPRKRQTWEVMPEWRKTCPAKRSDAPANQACRRVESCFAAGDYNRCHFQYLEIVPFELILLSHNSE